MATAIIVDSKVQDAVARAVALDLQRPLRETDILWSSWEESSGESGTDKKRWQKYRKKNEVGEEKRSCLQTVACGGALKTLL